jgi:hypothetical protein
VVSVFPRALTRPFSTFKFETATPSCFAASRLISSRIVAASSRSGCHKLEIDVLPPVPPGSTLPEAVGACATRSCAMSTSSSSAAICASPVWAP